MSISRRRFLKLGALSMFGTLSSAMGRLSIANAFPQSATDYRAAVCIFLVGGNDGNNTIIPNDDAGYNAYAAARKGLAIDRGALLPVQTRSGKQYAFHPKLTGLRNLFSNNKLAVLANVGTLRQPLTRSEYLAGIGVRPAGLLSHSDQQTQWQSFKVDAYGRAAVGWGGQIADALQSMNSGATYPGIVSVAGSNVYCQGIQTHPAAVTAWAQNGLSGFNPSTSSLIMQQAMQQLLSVDTDALLLGKASADSTNMLGEIRVQAEALAGLPSLTTTFPATDIASQLSMVAKMIQARGSFGLNRQLFFVALNGFDTHADQLPVHSDLLAQLDGAMAAFYQATVEMGVASQVTSFTLSDFGRALAANDTGTDHGWGNHQLIMGGAVNGGDVYGRFANLILGGEDDIGANGRRIPTTSVEQYGATIAAWLGVSSGDIPGIFPNIANFSTPNLGFLL